MLNDAERPGARACECRRRRHPRHPFYSPRVRLRRIPAGYAGTQRTVRDIQRLIREGARDFFVRQHAIDVLLERQVRPRDYIGEIKALFEWVQRNVRYTKDPFCVEVLHSAPRMLELRAGDCDDMAILLGAMLEAIGHPVRLVLTGPHLQRPDLLTHVHLEVWERNRWIALDPSVPVSMGWAPRAPVRQIFSLWRPS
jgi:transglutaminase-like putative cysteine protease